MDVFEMLGGELSDVSFEDDEDDCLGDVQEEEDTVHGAIRKQDANGDRSDDEDESTSSDTSGFNSGGDDDESSRASHDAADDAEDLAEWRRCCLSLRATRDHEMDQPPSIERLRRLYLELAPLVELSRFWRALPGWGVEAEEDEEDEENGGGVIAAAAGAAAAGNKKEEGEVEQDEGRAAPVREKVGGGGGGCVHAVTAGVFDACGPEVLGARAPPAAYCTAAMNRLVKDLEGAGCSVYPPNLCRRLAANLLRQQQRSDQQQREHEERQQEQQEQREDAAVAAADAAAAAGRAFGTGGYVAADSPAAALGGIDDTMAYRRLFFHDTAVVLRCSRAIGSGACVYVGVFVSHRRLPESILAAGATTTAIPI